MTIFTLISGKVLSYEQHCTKCYNTIGSCMSPEIISDPHLKRIKDKLKPYVPRGLLSCRKS